MVLAEQPKTLIEVTLKSYKKWIENCLSSELNVKFDGHKSERKNLLESSKSLFAYTKCKSVVVNDISTGAWENGEPVMMLYTEYQIDFKTFGYKLSNKLGEELLTYTTILIEKSLLQTDDLPSIFEIGDLIWQGAYNFDYKRTNPTLSNNKPIRISDQFVINESHFDMANSINCSQVDSTNNQPKVSSETEPLLKQINDNSHLLIMHASLINIANESIHAIDKFLTEPQNLNKDSVLSFGYELENVSKIYNDRAVQWIKFIDDKVEQIEDAAQKEKIKALRDEMANLKANERNILLDYKTLEEELARNMPDDLLSAILKLLELIGKELERGVQNLGREAEILAQNLEKNLDKAALDIGKQLERDVQNTGELFVAVEGYVENQINALGETLNDADKRIREGKIIDALWHLGTDHIKHTEENAFTALQESSLLNSIASSVVTIYGAPYGGAVYAAWFTYKQTGSLELALKTAVITYLTAEGMSYAKEIPDITKRTLMTSVVAATAIAASGGTEKDIIDGFLKGTALTIANETYKNMTTLEIEGNPATQGPLDKQALLKDKRLVFLNKEGQEVLDITKLSRDASHVGLDSGTGIFSEKGFLMSKFAEIPYVNDMAYFHDQWCAVQGFGLVPTVVTILPATILTVAGSGRPVIDQIIETINENQ